MVYYIFNIFNKVSILCVLIFLNLLSFNIGQSFSKPLVRTTFNFDKPNCPRSPLHDQDILSCDNEINKNANDPDLYINRSNGWIKVYNDKMKALADTKKALDLSPNYFRAHAAYAQHLLNNGDKVKAIDEINRAITLNPDYPNSYVTRADYWRAQNEPNKALLDLNKAIELDPSNSDTYGSLGLIYAKKKNFEKAVHYFTKSIKYDANNYTSYLNRGISRYKLNKYDLAIQDFSKAILINPSYINAYSYRAAVWSLKGIPAKAMEDFSQALKLDPNNANVNLNLCGHYVEKDNEKALIYCTASINAAITPDPLAYTNRGRAYFGKEDNIRSLNDFNTAINLDKNFSYAYEYRAKLYLKQKEFDKSISDYKEAVRLAPQSANLKEDLRLVLNKKSKIEGRGQSTGLTNKMDVVKNVNSDSLISASGKRLALVIGNDKYKNVSSLENASRDAGLIANTLRKIGFTSVQLHQNITRDQTLKLLNNFEKEAVNADWALIYYAGHGMEVSGTNYMIPIDAQVTTDVNISSQTVNLQYFLDSVESAQKLRIVILDACRNNPLVQEVRNASAVRSAGLMSASLIGDGLAKIEPELGTLVVYAAKHGEYALDGDGLNSPFAISLAKRIEQKPPLEVRRLFDYVREDVYETTKQQQQPFTYGSLSAKLDYYFDKN